MHHKRENTLEVLKVDHSTICVSEHTAKILCRVKQAQGCRRFYWSKGPHEVKPGMGLNPVKPTAKGFTKCTKCMKDLYNPKP